MLGKDSEKVGGEGGGKKRTEGGGEKEREKESRDYLGLFLGPDPRVRSDCAERERYGKTLSDRLTSLRFRASSRSAFVRVGTHLWMTCVGGSVFRSSLLREAESQV